jgi:hypothetical protein
MRFVVDKVALGQVFSENLFSPASYYWISAPYSSVNWGWNIGPLEAIVPRDSSSPDPQKKKGKTISITIKLTHSLI